MFSFCFFCADDEPVSGPQRILSQASGRSFAKHKTRGAFSLVLSYRSVRGMPSRRKLDYAAENVTRLLCDVSLLPLLSLGKLKIAYHAADR